MNVLSFPARDGMIHAHVNSSFLLAQFFTVDYFRPVRHNPTEIFSCLPFKIE
jgi:hypothetical protein